MTEDYFRALLCWPYQKEAFKLALDKPITMLFLEPGLGMTIEMINIQSQDRLHRTGESFNVNKQQRRTF